jgi:hypothetical protein
MTDASMSSGFYMAQLLRPKPGMDLRDPALLERKSVSPTPRPDICSAFIEKWAGKKFEGEGLKVSLNNLIEELLEMPLTEAEGKYLDLP